MDAFNIIRFRVKPGRKEDFIEAHRTATIEWDGLKQASLVQVGDRAFCLILQWQSELKMNIAKPKLARALERFRDCLEELSPKIGIAAAMSGPAVFQKAS